MPDPEDQQEYRWQFLELQQGASLLIFATYPGIAFTFCFKLSIKTYNSMQIVWWEGVGFFKPEGSFL